MSSEANKPEPFGYFRATPFGWEDCAQGDDGAQALYDETAISTQAARIASLEAERDQLRSRLDRAIGAAQEHFGEDCIRYKLSLFKNGRARNFFPPEMDGNRYAFQRADNDAHIGLCDTIDQLRAEARARRNQ